jgi:hypothetical protein
MQGSNNGVKILFYLAIFPKAFIKRLFPGFPGKNKAQKVRLRFCESVVPLQVASAEGGSGNLRKEMTAMQDNLENVQ